jgi:hypothetical protein
MSERGPLLAILDGFDEIATNSTMQERYVYFARLFAITEKCSHVLLTSRPAVFANFTELNKMVAKVIDLNFRRAHQFQHKVRKKDEDRDLALKKNEEIVKARTLGPQFKKFPANKSRLATLQPLSKNKILAFFEPHKDTLMRRHRKSPQQIYNAILSVYDLTDIITRPLLIDMFIYVLINGEIDLNDEDLLVGPVSLYQNYINLHLDRENLKSQFLSREARLAFARGAAKTMLISGGALEATLDRVATVVKETEELSELLGQDILERRLEQVVTDVRTCGFLNITTDDRIVFAHKSFMEFFVADLIYQKILKHHMAEELDAPLNYEILQFLGGFGMVRQDFRLDLVQHLSRIGKTVSERYRTNLQLAILFSERHVIQKDFFCAGL